MNERDVFIAALQQESRPQRQEYVIEACRGDDTLRQDVEALLDAHDRAGTFLQVPPNLLRRLGHYHVLHMLGQGGMGMVFLADDTRLQRKVALKVMRPELAANPASRQRFLREGRAAAQIHSDHVVDIYHVDQEGDLPFLVMEVLHGQSLAEALEQHHQLPIRQSLTIAREMSEGLAAAHAAGLIHRDIKPANVWLEEPNGRVKLLDFGLARIRTDPRITQRHVILCTPAYMSPEQAAGQPLDERCDLFSLGAVLYHMLTGQRPFPGDDLLTVVASLAKGAPPSAANLVSGLPAGVAKFLDRLLASDPASRPESAAEVARTLLELELQIDPSQPTSTASIPIWRRRRLISVLGIASLAVGLLVAMQAGAFRGSVANGPTSDAAVPPAPTAPRDDTPGIKLAELPPLREFSLIDHCSQIQSLAFTADSKTLISAEYFGGKVLFWDIARHEKTFQMFAVPKGFLECLAVDPQRHWLAASPYCAADQKHPGIRLFRVGEKNQAEATGELIGHMGRVVQLAFLKDGQTLLSTGYDGSIRSWDVQKRQEGKPLRTEGPRLDSLNVWEDGKGGLRLALGGMKFASLNDVVLERFPYSPGKAALSPDGATLACSKQDRVAAAKMSHATLWKLPDMTPLGELPDAPIPAGLAFTPDGRHVVVMSPHSTLIYKTATRQLVARVDHAESAVSLAISPDGRWLAIGTLKGPIRIWHLPSLLAGPI